MESDLNLMLTLLGPTVAIIAGYFFINNRITNLANELRAGIERLSNEHNSHDSKLSTGLEKFVETTEKNFQRVGDDIKETNTVLHGHIKDETVDHINILNEVKNNKCNCGGK